MFKVLKRKMDPRTPLSQETEFTRLTSKQGIFVHGIAKLIEFAYANGYTLTFGEAWRTNEEQQRKIRAGVSWVSRSLHQDRLAVDFNLFKDGKWLSKTEDHRPLGEYWESLHPLFFWGGPTNRGGDRLKNDGNHYSMIHKGRE